MEPQRDSYLWKQAKARVGFRMHLRSFLFINAGLWLVWALTNYAFRTNHPTGFVFPWPVFATLGWGIGLASHYVGVYHGQGQKGMIEREYQKLAGRQS